MQSLKLTVSFLLLLFIAGRMGLLLHEFGGHALAVHLIGGKAIGFKLFLFGGGWIQYGVIPAGTSVLPALIVQLSGMAVELVAGVALAAFAVFRVHNPTLHRVSAAISGVLIVHSLFYLVLCTYNGSGDGAVLFTFLHGSARAVFLTLASALTVVGAFLVSYAFAPATKTWTVSSSRKYRIGMILLSASGAALLHMALTAGEQIIVKDPAYAAIKTSENARLRKKALSQRIAEYTEMQGRKPDLEYIEALKKDLGDKYRQFPIGIPLGIAVLAALTAGFFLSDPSDEAQASPAGWKEIGQLSLFSALAAALILLLNAL